MSKFLKLFFVFGLLMGLLGFGLMFLGGGTANDKTHEPKSADKTAAQVMAEGYQKEKGDFQREFPTLKKAMPNLRWFSDDVGGKGADALESVDLITPFGPCILMVGGARGYSLVFGEDLYNPKRSSKFVGGIYPSRADAVQTAEEYCHRWYVTESNNPASPTRARPLWFTPDPEVAPLPVSTSESQGNSTDPSEQAAPIERSDPSQAPAPIERRPPPQN